MPDTITLKAAKRTLTGCDFSEPEFSNIGFEYFDESLVDFLYEVYMAMSASEWGHYGDNKDVGLEDVFAFYKNGVYAPLCKRIVLTGEVDIKNFDLPVFASLVAQDEADRPFNFMRAKQLDRLPVGWAMPTKGLPYKFTIMYRDKKVDNALKLSSNFMLVKTDGTIIPCIGLHKNQHGLDAIVHGAFAHWAAMTINAADDARHLWQVVTGEDVLNLKSQSVKTPLILGCDPERVKSLFYARSIPITASGRKRPILHWVEAHRRRMKSGTDVDISKHLRGIERFTMGGFDFEITSPRRPRR